MEVLLYFDYILCCLLYSGTCKLFLTSKEHKNKGVKAVGDWHATKNIFLFRYGMSLFCLQVLQGVMLKLLSPVLPPQRSGLGSLLISQNMDLQQNFLCRVAPWQSFLLHHCRRRYAINRVVQFQSFSLIFFFFSYIKHISASARDSLFSYVSRLKACLDEIVSFIHTVPALQSF